MKYSLRSLMIVAILAPAVLAACWQIYLRSANAAPEVEHFVWGLHVQEELIFSDSP